MGETALGSLLQESSTMRPDELPGAVRQKAALIGLEAVTIHLVDKRQLVLTPLPEADGERMDIDGTEAGRCYRESATVIVDDENGGTRLWFPMLDGTARIGVLGGTAHDADALLRERGERLAELAAELLLAKSSYGDLLANASRTEDMTLAAEIRWALLPPLTFLSPDVSIAGFLEPAYELAGDTFDYAVNANTAHVSIIDAVGHGMEASRIANLALLSYRHGRRRGLGLTDMYAAMDAAIEAAFEDSAFATMQVATLDLPDGVLRWISAGHPAPLLFRSGAPVRELPSPPLLPAGIGVQESEVREPEVQEEALRPGDVVIFYSDGITEARSDGGSDFGVERLGQLVTDALDSRVAPPELLRQVVHAVVEHQGGRVVDDATLVLLGWRL